jgi:Na+/glutamate symporter
MFVAEIFDKLFALAVLGIIFGSIFGFPFAMARMKQREKEKDGRTAVAANAETIGRLERLEERVKVLERIVTDDRADLHRQFREL